MEIRTEEESGLFRVFLNNVHVGNMYKEVDGYYVYEYNNSRSGFWEAHALRMIADKLDEMNKDWDEGIKEYFKNLKWRDV